MAFKINKADKMPKSFNTFEFASSEDNYEWKRLPSEAKVQEGLIKVLFEAEGRDPEFLLTFSAKGKTSMWRRRAKR